MPQGGFAPFTSSVADMAGIYRAVAAGDEMDRRRRADDAIAAAMKETGGDLDEALPKLRAQGFVDEALDYEQKAVNTRAQIQRNAAMELENDASTISMVIPMLKAAVDQPSYDRVLQAIRHRAPQMAEMLDPVFNADTVRGYEQIAMTAQQGVIARRQALEDHASGLNDLAMARYASTVASPEDFANMLENATALGIPRTTRERYGRQFSPEIQKRAQADVQRLLTEEADARFGGNTRSASERELAVRQKVAARASAIGKTVDELTEEELNRFTSEARQEYTNEVTSRGGTTSTPGVTVERAEEARYRALFGPDAPRRPAGPNANWDDYTRRVLAIENTYRRKLGQPVIPELTPQLRREFGIPDPAAPAQPGETPRAGAGGATRPPATTAPSGGGRILPTLEGAAVAAQAIPLAPFGLAAAPVVAGTELAGRAVSAVSGGARQTPAAPPAGQPPPATRGAPGRTQRSRGQGQYAPVPRLRGENVPPEVLDLLRRGFMGPGIYPMSDGSRWRVKADGTISRVTP